MYIINYQTGFIRVKLPSLYYKAGVFSVGPSSKRIEEL